MTARRALVLLIVATAALRFVWAASIGLGHDEAYHYLFATHPALSYFDHPPMLAAVESIGLCLGGSSPLALRFGFVLLFAGSTWLMARVAGRFFGEWAGFHAAFALNLSAYHTAAAGAFALPDGPLLFFWLLTIDRMASAMEDPDRIGRWVLVGLAWGLGLLSKYHAVFLPAGLLVYLAWTPSARRILGKPGPYVATVVGLACFAPVIVWNAGHGWVSFAFQGGRAVSGLGFRPGMLLASFGGQAAYLLPWIWIMLLIAMVGSVRRLIRREASDAERFLLSQSVTPLLLFSAVASVRDVLPHWTLIGYVSAFPLLGRTWAGVGVPMSPRRRRWVALMVAVPIVAAALMIVQYRTGLIPIERFTDDPITVSKADPTAQLYGWDQVVDGLKARGLLDRPDSFVFTGIWYNSGHLGYATRGMGVPVACYHPHDARSFAFWSRPGDWVGRDGTLVVLDGKPTDADAYTRWFERIEPAGEFPVVRAGKEVRQVRLYRCVRQLAPFPFDYDGPSRAGKRMEPRAVVAGEPGAERR